MDWATKEELLDDATELGILPRFAEEILELRRERGQQFGLARRVDVEAEWSLLAGMVAEAREAA